MYYFRLNFSALLAHQGERNKKKTHIKMVIHTSVLYRFLLVFGPPWWWSRRVEACGRKQYVIINTHANILQVYLAHIRQQCPHRQELAARIKLPPRFTASGLIPDMLVFDARPRQRLFWQILSCRCSFRQIRLFNTTLQQGDTRWRCWLRQCASSWKFACSIPASVIGISHSSGRTLALGCTQPITEMSIRDISWDLKAAGAYGWQLYHLPVPIVLKSGSLNLLEPSGPLQGLFSPSITF